MTVAAILISTLERRFRYDHCWRQVADWRICSIVARVQVPQIVNRGAVIDAKVHIWKEVGGVDDPPLHPASVSAFEIHQGHT